MLGPMVELGQLKSLADSGGRNKSGVLRTDPLGKTRPKFKEKRTWAEDMFFEFIQGFRILNQRIQIFLK
jgi:hypothetical protein